VKAVFGLAAVSAIVFGIVLDFQMLPLGVPSEWDWERIPRNLLPAWRWYLPALLVGAMLVGWVAAGVRWIETASRRRFVSGLLVTTALAGAFQLALELPSRQGLGKWIVAVYAPQVTGFFQVATHAPANASEILGGYPDLVRRLPPGHISANPPGWVVVDRAVLDFFKDAKRRRAFSAMEPAELDAMFDRLTPPMGAAPEERPAAVAIALASRLLSLLVVLPSAWLACLRHGRWAAWLVAGAAGMIPAAIMFAPRCDCVYATIITLAIGLAYHAGDRPAKASSLACGLLIGVGMLFSLCFLVAAAFCVAVVAALWLQRRVFYRWIAVAFAVGWAFAPLAILSFTGCNIGDTWLANLAKNAEFNDLTGRTYSVWAALNPIEFLVALGLPAGVLLIRRQASEVRKLFAATPDAVAIAWLAIMLLLNFSGSNRAEVARLWIFMMPAAAALAFEALPRDWRACAGFLGLQGLVCIVLCRELAVM
jgi:hypothetical protein